MSDSKPPVVLVSGFGRCGSSLVMQMLAAAQFPVTGEWPSFEVSECAPSTFDGAFIAACRGRAVKLLDPQYPFADVPRGRYSTIWLDRDHKQQAKSHAKFASVFLGINTDRRDRAKLAASYAGDRPAALKKLHSLGPVITIRFEDLIQNPRRYAAVIAGWVGIDIASVDLMAGAVRPRSADCLPDLLELRMIEEKRAALAEGMEGKGNG